jgi:hypothetical protein
VAEQRRREAEDRQHPFEAFRQAYLAPEQLLV